MNKEQFSEILKEYDYSDEQIDILWAKAPPVIIEEELRDVAAYLRLVKDSLIPV